MQCEGNTGCGRRGFVWGFFIVGLTTMAACHPQPVASSDQARASSRQRPVRLRPSAPTLAALLAYEDTDGDRRITILDEGAKRFVLPDENGSPYEVRGTYQLANLVQELFLAHVDRGELIPIAHVEEPIADRISRLIRDRYWKNLSRRIDDGHLEQVLADPKTDSSRAMPSDDWPKECTAAPRQIPQFLYVPHSDQRAYQYYSGLVASHPTLVVCRLPEAITAEWVRSLDATATRGSRHGLLSLAFQTVQGKLEPLPYGVPGGRFNEMYGWDSYFHVLGLLEDDQYDLARAQVDNLLYEVHHYGKVLNANRTYYLNRSQPPFLSSAVRAVWEKQQRNQKWLSGALRELVAEYENVWSGRDRLTPLCGEAPQGSGPVCLSTYRAGGMGEPPEVEPGHFDWLYREKAALHGQDAKVYRRNYRQRKLPAGQLEELDWFFMQDRSMRESGHDTTYRWTTAEGDRCADFATVDLNALLFKYELDLAHLSKQAGLANWNSWCDRANVRRELIRKHLYNGELFVDYHLQRNSDREFSGAGQKSDYISATTFYPLWASADSPCADGNGEPLSLFSSADEKKRLVATALGHLEVQGGLAATARDSSAQGERATPRQWDYPFGWAPHQILAWEGLRHHGFELEAERLTYKWLYMISKNAHDFHGMVPEKYDVVRGTHQVFAEYGNVGTEFSYITTEGFGWMNASYQLGKSHLPKELVWEINRLTPPSEVGFTAEVDFSADRRPHLRVD